MERPSHLVLTSNRTDEADWLTEMSENGWRLVTVYEGKFYFESVDVMASLTAEALQRNFRENGAIRDVIETAADVGVARAKSELRL